MKFQNVFIDLDGTVARSGEGIKNALAYMFGKIGIKTPDDRELNKFIGPPIRTLLKDYGITGQAVEDAYAFFREYYETKGIYEMEPYEGIPALLRDLNAAGLRVHLATAKRRDQGEVALRHLQLRDEFQYIFGADTVRNVLQKKEILESAVAEMGGLPEGSVMVGDRAVDINGGRDNGFATIGVLYGYGEETEIRGAAPDMVAADVADLGRILLEGK